MRQQKIADPNFAVRRLQERFEKLNNDALKPVTAHGIEIVLSVATNLEDSSLLEQCQVMAHGWLALIQAVAEFGNVQFFFLQQEEDDSKPVGIRQHFAEMGQLRTEFFRGILIRTFGFCGTIRVFERSNHGSFHKLGFDRVLPQVLNECCSLGSEVTHISHRIEM